MLNYKEGLLDLESITKKHLRRIYRNLHTPVLYEDIIKNREGELAHLGPIVVRTGHYTERNHEDKFIVKEPVCEGKINWNEKTKEISIEHFNNLLYRLLAYLQNKDVYFQDSYLGNDPRHRIPLRIITETAWHSLYARNMYVQISTQKEFEEFKPEFTIIHVPGFHAIPDIDGTRSSSFIITSMGQKVVLIGGTSYAGEIREAAISISNFLLSEKGLFTLRCSANMGTNGDVAIFLGRAGTGRSTLATDPERRIVGDYEHAWTDDGLFSLDGGCYPKILNTSKEDPLIYQATRRFGTILENVFIDPETKRVDLTDKRLTENLRACYPISHIPNAVREGICGHPSNIFLLTCDAFGVLPPLARLTTEQTVFAFLSSYTSRFTEKKGEMTEPNPVFSVCFGASPISIQPHEYAKTFMEKIKKHNVTCWLMNTGWVGEPCGNSERIKISCSRALINAVVTGKLKDVEYETDPVFQFEIPKECPGIPANILNPRMAAKDEGEYEVRANRLAYEFMKDYSQFETLMPETMRSMLSNIISIKDSVDLLEEFSLSM
ncbi:MAG: phosphoenolpyruvate carboxykinase (ATP) [Desulfobacterales bacterium]|nr:phosphoenolpyruvate carboxykinase (ATP) [Desulfobacterales bacterium]MBF0397142.1 phosphoenolpyruvate carboxykinase (ATP) [Desulfobacterales bacterium]